MSVVGARPNFMKVAPIIAAIRRHNDRISGNTAGEERFGSTRIQHVLVHTGQHYDPLMSGAFFTDLNLPKPDVDLGVGSGSHAVQTAEIMKKFEEVLLRERPDVLLVIGDINSTLACAVVAAKISFDDSGTRPLIAHVEAGLRSFDRGMPEEINRVLTDQVSDLLFVTEESGLRNLSREGVAVEKVHFVGNTMIDSLLAFKDKADASTILDELGLRHNAAGNGADRAIVPYALLTLHRPANVDGHDAFSNILEGLEELARDYVVVFPAHPRTRTKVKEMGLDSYFKPKRANQTGSSELSCGVRMIEPLGYLNFLCLMKNAALVVTDSGGIQEETTCLGVPCVTVRENTERPITITNGTNILAGVQKDGIREAVKRQLGRTFTHESPEKWDGNAGSRIVDILLQTTQNTNQSVRALPSTALLPR